MSNHTDNPTLQSEKLEPWDREPDPCWSCGGEAEARDDIHVRCIDSKGINCEVMGHWFTRKTWNSRAPVVTPRETRCDVSATGQHRLVETYCKDCGQVFTPPAAPSPAPSPVHTLLLNDGVAERNTIAAATSTPVEQEQKLVEVLAALAHEQWSNWMWYMLSKVTLTNKTAIDFRERWWRQMNTRYSELPEEEKESDRTEVRRMLEAFRTAAPSPSVREAAEQARRIIGNVKNYECEWNGISQGAFKSLSIRIASALSSRDTEIREVLEGLRYSEVGWCWCKGPGHHSKACEAARALYVTLRPKEASDVDK